MEPDFIDSLGAAFIANRLRRISDLIVEGCAPWLAEQGLEAPPRSASLLLALQTHGPAAVTSLAQRIRLSHPFVVRTAGDLERLGLVITSADPGDRRRRIVSLTAAGERQAQLMALTRAPMAAAVEGLQRDAGVDLLGALIAVEQALKTRPFRDRLSPTSQETS